MRVQRRRVHLQRVQREHTGGLGQQARPVRRDHRHDRRVVLLLQQHVRLSRRRNAFRHRHVHGVERFRFGQRLPGHRLAAAGDQVGHQRGLPVRPHAGAGRDGVRLRQRVQQFQQDRVAAERLDHAVHGRLVLDVPPGRGVRQQQVMPDHRGQRLDVLRPQPDALPDLGRQRGPDLGVVLLPALADVVDQRAEQQQVRPRHRGRQPGRVGDGLHEMPVDRPHVRGVARRQVPHRTPLGEQPAPQVRAVQRFHDVHQSTTAAQQRQQFLAGLARPRLAQLRRRVREPGQRSCRDRVLCCVPPPSRHVATTPDHDWESRHGRARPQTRAAPRLRPTACAGVVLSGTPRARVSARRHERPAWPRRTRRRPCVRQRKVNGPTRNGPPARARRPPRHRPAPAARHGVSLPHGEVRCARPATTGVRRRRRRTAGPPAARATARPGA